MSERTPDANGQPVIEVKNLTKAYRLGVLESFRTTAKRLLGRAVDKQRQFKALDDVSFSIQPGEVVGIVGHNGAGKSTLLKHLCGITTPTSGSVTVRGRVAPLIEVGAGLIGELSGLENIYLNGVILGQSKADIDAKVDEIIEFSELADFIDTPVKRYSSGMQARLGFAIATSIDADILIVDEVLSVGDLAFQRKCFERMDQLLRRGGKTVLFVSHNLRQVERLCSRALLLDHGKLLLYDTSSVVCESLFERMQGIASARTTVNTRIESTGEISLCGIEVSSDDGRLVDSIRSGQSLKVTVEFSSSATIEQPSIIIGTHTPDYIYINAGSSATEAERPDIVPGVHRVSYEIPAFPVIPGVYLIRFSVYDGNHRPVFLGESLSSFMVTPSSGEIQKAGMRLIEIPGRWSL